MYLLLPLQYLSTFVLRNVKQNNEMFNKQVYLIKIVNSVNKDTSIK